MIQLVRIKKVKYLIGLLQVQAREVMGGNERKQQNMNEIPELYGQGKRRDANLTGFCKL